MVKKDVFVLKENQKNDYTRKKIMANKRVDYLDNVILSTDFDLILYITFVVLFC